MSIPVHKLGKQAPKIDTRTLKLSNYLRKLPPIPPEVSWITKLKAAMPIPMYLNDQLGDCVIAAAGHMIQQWNFYAGHPSQPSDADILKAYEDVGGYVPGDPSTDNGAVMLDCLKYWRKTGIGGHKIVAFAALDTSNIREMQAAIYLFGSLYVGIALPLSVQGTDDWTVATGGVYTDKGEPGGWGGHCVNLPASSPITYTCETWGDSLKMSHNFLKDYLDEGYVVLSQEWLDANQMSPEHFDLTGLLADLHSLVS